MLTANQKEREKESFIHLFAPQMVCSIPWPRSQEFYLGLLCRLQSVKYLGVLPGIRVGNRVAKTETLNITLMI